MKKTIAILTLVFTIISVSGQTMSQKDSVSRCIGMDMARMIKNFDTTLNPEIIAEAFIDTYKGKMQIDDKEIQRVIQGYMASKEAERQKKAEAQNSILAAAAAATIDSIAAIDGISRTPSGLLYKIETMGGATIPQDGDMVTVHYTLKTLDGEILDSSYDHGEPINYQNISGQMIEGFREGVQLLGEGGKATLYLPPHLGYGDRNMGQIKPHQILVFEVNLLGITPKK